VLLQDLTKMKGSLSRLGHYQEFETDGGRNLRFVVVAADGCAIE